VVRIARQSVGFILLTAIIMLVGGCGVYTLNPAGKSKLASIAVEPFENRTSEYGLTDRITEIIVDAFIADGTIKVLPPSSADAVLTGVLTRYQRVPQEYDENDQVQKYKVVMDFEIALKNPDDQSDIWKEQMRQEGIYDATSEMEEDGQRLAGQRLVEAVINRTTKSW
jgi:hypothetical protein